MATRFIGYTLVEPKGFNQKLDYIHLNPVVAGLCQYPEDYKYSSASFYTSNDLKWDFLTPSNG
jgi:putative transposase